MQTQSLLDQDIYNIEVALQLPFSVGVTWRSKRSIRPEVETYEFLS